MAFLLWLYFISEKKQCLNFTDPSSRVSDISCVNAHTKFISQRTYDDDVSFTEYIGNKKIRQYIHMKIMALIQSEYGSVRQWSEKGYEFILFLTYSSYN